MRRLLALSLMLTLGAAEGLMASVLVYYAAKLLGAPMGEKFDFELKRPEIFEKLISASMFWEKKCDDEGECGVEFLTDEQVEYFKKK